MVLSSAAKPCSTCSGGHGLASSCSAKQHAYRAGLPYVDMLIAPARAPPRFAQIKRSARPIVAFARWPGPSAPAPPLMPSAPRAGPFTMKIGATASVVPETPTRLNASSHIASTPAITTGRYSGRQPAITALTAMRSTVARPSAGATSAINSSRERPAPAMAASTRSRVGGTTGSPSVTPRANSSSNGSSGLPSVRSGQVPRAVLHRRRRSRRRLREEAIDLLDQEEDGERDDDEIDHRVQEHAVVQRGRSGGLRGSERRERLPGQADEEVLEVHATEEPPDRRHDDVVDERGDDRPERGAHDHTDRQVDDVTPHDERLELAQHGLLPLSERLECVVRPPVRLGVRTLYNGHLAARERPGFTPTCGGRSPGPEGAGMAPTPRRWDELRVNADALGRAPIHGRGHQRLSPAHRAEPMSDLFGHQPDRKPEHHHVRDRCCECHRLSSSALPR